MVSATLVRARQQWKRSAPDGDGNDGENGEGNFFAAQEEDKAYGGSSPDGNHVLTGESERELDLCAAVSSLGPVAVKIGQTLSQRPDIVGHDAARALQRLQTKNLPYPNEWAYQVLREELDWVNAPLAPDIVDAGLTNPMAKPLFARMTIDPVACASLGQVYKATLWDGREVAVKVQRPDAMSILAKDTQCFRNVFSTRRRIQKVLERNNANNDVAEQKQDIGSIIDRVSKDVLKELDYRLEAKNSVEFRESLAFLGFVTTPDIVWDLSTTRVLVTEWVPGRHLSDLTRDEGLLMTRMAVEACTASMVLTGFIHNDPHEGNIMLHDDGKLVFLDFGLMSRVDEEIMEGFARGIQALLSEDWSTLAEAFVDVGFVSKPIMHRFGLDDTWTVDPKFGLPQLAEDLAIAMETTEGGKARFGSLATVLNKKISPYWLVYTPPYVLLLVRTFLTLEGVAAKVDPTFNIYEMAMPWAIRRSLSPSTQKGMDAFRSTVMTPDNRVQWSRFLELVGPKSTERSKDVAAPSDEIHKASGQSKAQKDAMKAAVGSLLGSPKGRVLRRTLRDLDSTDLLDRLSSKSGRHLLQNAVLVATKNGNPNWVKKPGEEPSLATARPVSEEFIKMKERERKWRRKVGKILLWAHVKKQIGLRGLRSCTIFSLVMLRIAVSVFTRKLFSWMKPAKNRKQIPASAAL